jgi:hypothetical protein
MGIVNKMSILNIIQLVREGSIDPDDAERQIKLLFEEMVADSAIGISSLDATEMYGKINRELEKI